ncbi:hypothetical protein HA402_010449 [Bradysia odoriphaga]|nr:hypothetical protein HA402_010449 [Bradysia odoriphaga]
MGIHHIINEADYRAQIRQAGRNLVLIRFFATWCGHCTMVKPSIENLHNEFKGSVVFLEVDIDENGDITRQEYVVGVPTFVFYKNNARVDVTTSEAKLREMIAKHK